ncbi:hypothetical protein TKK_0005043 [Trichogramma kaykai]
MQFYQIIFFACMIFVGVIAKPGDHHEHVRIHVPYKIHTVHHHHVKTVHIPVTKIEKVQVPVPVHHVKKIEVPVPYPVVEKVVEKVHVPIHVPVHIPVHHHHEPLPVHHHHESHHHQGWS